MADAEAEVLVVDSDSEVQVQQLSAPTVRSTAAAEPCPETEKFPPTYSVPDSIFKLKGKGPTQGSWIFTCLKCVGNKTITASYKSRYNLRQHVISRHNRLLSDFDNHSTTTDKRSKTKPAASGESSSGIATPAVSILEQLTGPKVKLTQSALDQYIVDYLSESALPFHHVETSSFRTFVAHLAPGLQIKTAKTYQKKATGIIQQLKDDLVVSFKASRKVCLTLDHWSSHHKGYLGVTAHWFEKRERDGNQLERKSACIALRRIYGRVTYNVLGKLIESIMAEYGLTSSKVSDCITDSGSNFVKAFKEYAAAESEPDTEPVDELETGELVRPTEIQDILSYDPVDENVECYELPTHFRCTAHRLNLIAAKDSEAGLNNPICKKWYRSLIGKLQALWNKQSRSVVVSDKIKSTLDGLFVVPNDTRWNSTYDSMVRFQALYTAKEAKVNLILNYLNLRPLTKEEVKMLDEFIMVMKPLCCALDELQGQTHANIGHLLPTLHIILMEWDSMTELELTSPLKVVLCDSVKRRFADEFASEKLKVAAALNPSFHLHWVPVEDSEEVTRAVRKALSSYINDTTLAENSQAGR